MGGQISATIPEHTRKPHSRPDSRIQDPCLAWPRKRGWVQDASIGGGVGARGQKDSVAQWCVRGAYAETNAPARTKDCPDIMAMRLVLATLACSPYHSSKSILLHKIASHAYAWSRLPGRIIVHARLVRDGARMFAPVTSAAAGVADIGSRAKRGQISKTPHIPLSLGTERPGRRWAGEQWFQERVWPVPEWFWPGSLNYYCTSTPQ